MAEEFQAALCGGVNNYYWWNTAATPPDSGGLVLDSGFGDWIQPNNNHLSSRGGESESDIFNSVSHNSYVDDTNVNSNYTCSSLLKTLFEPDHDHDHSEPSLSFSNITPFWNANAAAPTEDLIGASFISCQSQIYNPTFEHKPNSPNLSTTKVEAAQKSTLVRKGIDNNNAIDQPVIKRARIETPSPLPTFKVRKEKLGDRITALQQLVSPFGKTDTASVLHEAIEYIKFLHDQVSVLSAPYIKTGAHPLQHQQVSCDKLRRKSEFAVEAKQDLRSRGLCLVPISTTFPVANDDFWTPTFGATFR